MSILRLKPDLAISAADIPSAKAGKNRLPKMAYRTEMWLQALLKEAGGKVPICAPVLPVELSNQKLYIETLVERKDELAGLALYDTALAAELPEELKDLPRLALDNVEKTSVNPHEILKAISWGVDIFNTGLLTVVTDMGVALDISFPGERDAEEVGTKAMGIDLWDKSFAAEVSPLLEGCDCYACRNHHRAYINHLLNAKEMTAWVLLQMYTTFTLPHKFSNFACRHNTRVLNKFFAGVRASIARGTFEEDRATFAQVYDAELPQKTGDGPRQVTATHHHHHLFHTDSSTGLGATCSRLGRVPRRTHRCSNVFPASKRRFLPKPRCPTMSIPWSWRSLGLRNRWNLLNRNPAPLCAPELVAVLENFSPSTSTLGFMGKTRGKIERI